MKLKKKDIKKALPGYGVKESRDRWINIVEEIISDMNKEYINASFICN